MISDPAQGSELASVLEVEDPTQQALAESALREASIDFVTRNEPLQHLVGVGQIGGTNLVAGPPTIQVASRDVVRARAVIDEALGSGGSSDETPDELEETPSDAEQLAIRHARYSAVWGLLYLWGVGSVLAVYFGLRSLSNFGLLPTRSKVLATFGTVSGLAGLVAFIVVWGP